MKTDSSLKEWPAAIEALSEGNTILLLRKGGIHERGSSFQLPTKEAILFPTFEHQKTEMLKQAPSTNSKFKAYELGELIPISTWVKFIKSWEISSIEQIKALTPFHIWTEEFILKRFNWKPERPLFLIACEAFKLKSPQSIPFQPKYRGCKSWIQLETSIDLADSVKALPSEKLNSQLQVIQEVYQSMPSH